MFNTRRFFLFSTLGILVGCFIITAGNAFADEEVAYTGVAMIAPQEDDALPKEPQTASGEDGNIIVEFGQDPTVDRPEGVELVESVSRHKNLWKVKVPAHAVDEALDMLEMDEDVIEAEPNLVRQAFKTPNDTYFDDQWFHTDADGGISSDEAWDTQTGKPGVVVAVIDSGMDLDHPDLQQNRWTNADEVANNNIDDDGNGYVDDRYGYDFVMNRSNPNPKPDGKDNDNDGTKDDGVSHGSHVAGLVGAVGNNSTGVSGVAWDVQLMTVKVMDDEGIVEVADLVSGIEYAVDNGADIINLSLGAPGYSAAEAGAIDYARGHGVLVIAAAGNETKNLNSNPYYPVCYDGVLGVAASTSAAQPAVFTNFGSDCVDVIAPGRSILSTMYKNPSYGFDSLYAYADGTSMASPIVAGIAALVLSEQPVLTRTELMEVIENNTVDIGLSAHYGSGRVDADKALGGANTLENPSGPTTVHAWNNKEKDNKFTSGERYTDQKPYFKWQKAEDEDGIAGYYVYFGRKAHADPETKGVYQPNRSYIPAKLNSGDEVSYHLRVKAVDNKGNVTTEAASFEYVLDTETKQPGNLRVRLKPNGLKVAWDKKTGSHIEEYKIKRRRQGSSGWKTVKRIGHPKENYTDKKVNRETTYEYKVVAVDDLGNKKSTNTVNTLFYPRENLVVAAGAGGSPMVRVYSTARSKYFETWYAFPASWNYGVEVAVGNLDGDRRDEIVAAPGPGGDPRVRVFDADGSLKHEFFAYHVGFRGGVRVGTGDFDGDGIDEIVTVPGPGGSPHVRMFEADGYLIGEFLSLDGRFTGGAFVSGVQWDGYGQEEVAVSVGEGGGPYIYVHDASNTAVIAFMQPYDAAFRGGVRVSRVRLGGTGPDGLVAVPENGHAYVQTYQSVNGGPQLLQPGYYGLHSAYSAGASITAGDLQQKRADRTVLGSNGSTTAVIHEWTRSGSAVKHVEYPFGGFTGPVHVASGWVR